MQCQAMMLTDILSLYFFSSNITYYLILCFALCYPLISYYSELTYVNMSGIWFLLSSLGKLVKEPDTMYEIPEYFM